MVTTTIMKWFDILMSFSIDNHNELVRWVLTMSFENKYYDIVTMGSYYVNSMGL